MKTYYFDRVTEDDLEIRPKRFDNEQDGHARVYCIENMATFFKDGPDQPPLTFFRHMQADRVRWAGIVRAGEGPLAVQTAAHVADIANTDNPTMHPYSQIGENPAVYGYRIDEPYCEYRYSAKEAIWQEGAGGEILHLRAEPFPYALFIHRLPEICNASTLMVWPCILSGTYEGRPISAMGQNTRQFIPEGGESKEEQEKNYQKTTSYLCVYLTGVREDGRREMIYLYGLPGQMVGGYWIDGEEPVTGHVELSGEWRHLPYVEDGTCVCTQFDLKVGEKKVHFDGKWGYKGWTEKANVDKHGQSQVAGTWYEGDTPYRHLLWDCFVENMDAYDYILREAGYRVVD